MKPATLERWVWVLIYGGAGLAMLGLWSFDRDPGVSWVVLGLGVALVALGLVGIVWRARLARTPGSKAAR